MRNTNKLGLAVLLVLAGVPHAYAAKPAEHPLAAKLQAMVRQLTTERDAMKAENAKIVAETEQLRAELVTVKQSVDAASAAAATNAATAAKLQAEVAAAQSSNQRLQGQYESTRTKLHEVHQEGQQLSQTNGQLNQQLIQLQQKQTFTATELEACGQKNVALIKTTKEMVGDFNNRGFFTTLMGKEPMIGFSEVDLENQLQAYQDKLVAQQYLKKPDVEVVLENPEAVPAEEAAPAEAEANGQQAEPPAAPEADSPPQAAPAPGKK